ncbi:formate dehydrogenase accessory sulfurtransferase FdhD [Thermotoga caldifontis]|uniref:formate dehydrogenase accessory sulfurtransferase FdhD n=1 Tax=Thermotoga caldifontis TaxID=1508419 RepID=UPI0006936BDD|nr:formate dehydrogenase accessory sulfurtransferase FdhD [Thermotoga caldifontis]
MLLKILRIESSGNCVIMNDELIEDSLLDFYVNDVCVERFHCLAQDLEELALGHLIYMGTRPNRWSVRIDNRSIRIFLEDHQKVEDELLPFKTKVSARKIIEAMEDLLNDPLHKTTGAVHIAGLYDKDGKRLVRFEDVGRHNVVDKVIGWIVKNDVPAEGKMLLCSGRLPADMVLKCVRARVEILASKAPALMSAIGMAQRYGLTLIGFVREKRMNVYTNPSRIEEVSV